MRLQTGMLLITLTFSGVHAPPASADANSWAGFRGNPSGVSDELPASFGLTVGWDEGLGAGYSSLAVAQGLVVTLYTDGDKDVLAAFDAATGKKHWHVRFDAKYDGHDGSDDGPLASPTIADNTVYALGPKGQLVAARLKDGRELWRVQLDESNSTVPFYGYTCSPLPVDDLLIVLTGGAGGTVKAFDRATGELRWSQGDDTIAYQSPIVAELAGRRQIVAVGGQYVVGLDVKTGEQLWSFQHTEGNEEEELAHPIVIDDHRVLINLGTGGLALKVSKAGQGFEVEELWRSRAFANASVLPVLHDGTLYGFTGRILAAVNPDDGQFLWRSRAARAFNLSLVDGRLAVLSDTGELVIAEASPEAYSEVSRLQVFDRGDYADPAYAAGHFFIRNQQRLAAVRVDQGVAPTTAPAEQDPHRYHGDFGAWVKGVEAMPEGERQAAVDDYFKSIETMPLVNDDGSVHFIYRGDVMEVSIQGTIFGWGGEEQSLYQVPGTDLLYRTLMLDPAGNYDYTMNVDFGRPGPDPKNPHQISLGRRTGSELRMPGWRANPELADPAEDKERGTLHTFRFHSEILSNAREVQVWMPPAMDPETKYPLLIVNSGDAALGEGKMQNILDNMVGERMAPVVAVFVPRLSAVEYNGEQAPAYGNFLMQELIPHLERHYPVGERRAAMGVGSAGVISLQTALAHPGTIAKVAVQSFYLTDRNRDVYWELVESSEARPEVWVETGPNDYFIERAGIDARASAESLIERLREKGLDVDAHTVHAAAGWAGWRGQTDLILESFFPVASE